MHRWTCWTLALAGMISLSTASSARALVVAPPPGPNRVAQADAIVVGRVVAHEDKDIEVQLGRGKITYRIAIINVAENVKGVKGAKMVRVGFIPTKEVGNPAIGVRPIFRPGMRSVSFEIGQDGMFFLTKLPKDNIYTAPMYYDAVLRSAPNFATELQEAKNTVKILENPLDNLKNGSAEVRMQTASLLLTKYRQVRFSSGKTEPIDAEESKLILKAIHDGNWGPVAGRPGFAPVNSLNLFYQLGVNVKDGFKVAPGTNPQDAAKEWLAKNWETYRIQRIIPGEGPGGVRPVTPGVILPRPILRPMPLPIKNLKLKIQVDRN